jgi:hypothetical protein
MSIIKKDYETRFTAGAFIVAALFIILGWGLSSHHINEYIVASDFEAIGENVWYWIWVYRVFIFGWVIFGIAMMALTTSLTKKPYRVIALPGAGLVVIGTFFLAIAYAYYYNYGAWGVGMTAGKSAEEVQVFMDNILYTNQYVTCFIRFGRVFSGLGMLLLGYAFVKWRLVPQLLGWFTALFGLAAMGIIMGLPEYYEYYKPMVFIKIFWMVAMGVVLLKRGINIPEASDKG